jgi:hypothetical protein
MKTFLRKPVFAIALLLANLFFVKHSFGQITQTVAWAKAYDQASGTGSGISFAIPNGSNRILIVGVTASVTNSGSFTVNSLTYGGVALANATSNMNQSSHVHTALYYLKDNPVMDNTSRPIAITLSGTTANMTVWYAVFAGVNQAPLSYTNGTGFTNNDGSGPAALSAVMAVNAGEQAVYISNIQNANNTTPLPAYTINGNWTSGGSMTGSGGGEAWKNEVAKRTIPVSNTTDNASTSAITPTGNIRWAMSAMSLPPQLQPVLAISGTTNHGSACLGIPATTITYTITNTGNAAASGIAVNSNNPEFVVSNLSSATIAAGGGTATYQVTFTAGSSGAKNATITVTSTTPGSNSPVNSLTGTGNAIPVTSVVGQSNVNCFAGSDGSITIGATGGTGPYFYSVNNGTVWTATTHPSPFAYGGLSANTQYRIRVKDSNGCLSK